MTNPLEVIEQINYLLFLRRLDDEENRSERMARAGETTVENPLFASDKQNLRWSKWPNHPETLHQFVDREAAKATFGEFLSGTQYSSVQIDFVNGVIDYLTERGTIKVAQLYSAPLTSHPDGVEGIFPRDYDILLGIVRDINSTARVT